LLGRPLAAADGGALEIQLGDGEAWVLVLRVFERAPGAPDQPDTRFYRKGRTPRLELTVDDVGASVDEVVSAGATVACRLAPGADGVLRRAQPGQQVVYAQVVDPFGHLWAFTLAER
jgi:uncharacterized glyoxalase superfamily protein PhnB